MNELGLLPFDCGGDGDCYFKSVSHQLFGSSANHLAVRLAGVSYLRDHPEDFIEFVDGQSWSDYLCYMSRKGTWCDAPIVQAVADAYHLRIHIIESAQNFADTTIVEQHHFRQQSTSIFIGHIDEYHYVSTVRDNNILNYQSDSAQICTSNSSLTSIETEEESLGRNLEQSLAVSLNNEFRYNDSSNRKRNAYMSELMRKKRGKMIIIENDYNL